MAPPISLALDLGSTRLKAAALDKGGRLRVLAEAAPPPLRGTGLVREMDASALLSRASRTLREAAKGAPRGKALGIASQRSTFLLWDSRTGKPATNAISWQDRRAADWCERRKRRGWERRLWPRTGLPLSPHYAACKLSAMLERDRDLRAGLKRGRLLFGTLETWLLWSWTEGRHHATDLTMAARTLLADPRTGDWSGDRLRDFGIPRGALPEILPTAGLSLPLPFGLRLAASIADQPAVLLAATGGDPGTALVNLGTGCFVLAGTGTRFSHLPGYLSGPILGGRGSSVSGTRNPEPGAPKPEARNPKLETSLYALEGTVNGGGAVADRFGQGPTRFPSLPPQSSALSPSFCLPDSAGVGAPYWRPEVPLIFSEEAERLPQMEKRRVVLEGIVFRILGILEDIGSPSISGPQRTQRSQRNNKGNSVYSVNSVASTEAFSRILVSGGLANDPFVPAALAACLGRTVEVMTEHEGTLLGAARLAAGLDPCAKPRTRIVRPDPRGAYLPEKYRRWRKWLQTVL